MWHEAYLGIPWSGTPKPLETLNCGELIRWVFRKDFGYECLPIPVPDARNLRDCVKAMDPRYFGFLPVEGEPKDKDAVFMSKRRMMDHCGLAVQTPEGVRILHCSQRGGTQLSTMGELRGQGWTVFSWWRCPNG